jgi:hypothetical protein
MADTVNAECGRRVERAAVSPAVVERIAVNPLWGQPVLHDLAVPDREDDGVFGHTEGGDTNHNLCPRHPVDVRERDRCRSSDPPVEAIRPAPERIHDRLAAPDDEQDSTAWLWGWIPLTNEDRRHPPVSGHVAAKLA